MMLSTNENTKHNLLIIAGEESGDLIGADLIRELMVLNSQLVVFGIGGDRMQSEGMNILYHIKDIHQCLFSLR